jgi:hypothetical protein
VAQGDADELGAGLTDTQDTVAAVCREDAAVVIAQQRRHVEMRNGVATRVVLMVLSSRYDAMRTSQV